MSEQAPETPRSGGGNILNKPIGPLPLWAWMGLGLASILAYMYYKHSQSTAASSSSSSTGSGGTTDTSTIPQFVNQVYTNPAPPSSQNPGNPQQVQNVPIAPKEASATPYENYADFGWSGVPGAASYKLRIYTVKGNKQVVDTTVNGLHYSAKNLSPNTEYKWQVSDPLTGGATQWMTFTTKAAPKSTAPAPKSTAPAKPAK